MGEEPGGGEVSLYPVLYQEVSTVPARAVCSVYGETLQELGERAVEEFATFFGDTKFRITEADCRRPGDTRFVWQWNFEAVAA